MGMGDEILVVRKELLFNNKQFEGFLPQLEHDFIPNILNKFEYHLRDEGLENNPELQQIIPYVWILNPDTKQVFAFKRAPNENYTEKRLRDKWSCGIGGHIDKQDAENPIINAMMRELKEEVNTAHYPKPKNLGYLNLNHDVHSVHFGIVYIMETSFNVFPRDSEMTEGKFFSINELENLFSNPKNDIEEWTKVSWPFIKEYINSR